MEDWPVERPIKEKKKEKEKSPPPKMIVMGSVNPIPITPVGPVRPMQIPGGSMPVLLVSKTKVASAARVNKPTALAMPVHFSKNVPKGANTGMIEVELPQMYTFPKKYPRHPVTKMHYEESEKKFFIKKASREDTDK